MCEESVERLLELLEDNRDPNSLIYIAKNAKSWRVSTRIVSQGALSADQLKELLKINYSEGSVQSVRLAIIDTGLLSVDDMLEISKGSLTCLEHAIATGKLNQQELLKIARNRGKCGPQRNPQVWDALNAQFQWEYFDEKILMELGRLSEYFRTWIKVIENISGKDNLIQAGYAACHPDTWDMVLDRAQLTKMELYEIYVKIGNLSSNLDTRIKKMLKTILT